MKTIKLLFAFVLAAGVVSCSSDDDGNSDGPDEVDKIVGEWKLQSLSIDGEPTELTDCDLQTRINFMANGNFTVTSSYEDFDTEDCVSEVSNESWTKLGNNTYRVTDEGETIEITLMFSNNDNNFTFTEENETGSYSITYVRG